MLKDITLGQYFPGRSLVHRLDSRLKLLLLVAYIVALFMCRFVASYALMLCFVAVSVAASGISPRILVRGLKPLLFILVFTGVLNLFTGGGDVLWSWWRLTITDRGVQNAVFMLLRILMLVCGTLLLTYTTSPIMLTDALARLLSPLARLRVPVQDLAMMMTIALRFIPTIIEETDKIMSAQKARGADFETGSVIQRARALVPLLIPLFISAFRRAEELADAMECRCYNTVTKRTRLKQMHLTGTDVATAALCVLVFAGAIVLGRFGL